MTCLMIDIGSTELSNKDEERLQNKLVGALFFFQETIRIKNKSKL